MSRARTLALAGTLLAALACGGPKEDPILRLSAEEAYEKGQQLLEDKKYTQAGEHFAQAYQVAPNSEVGREALLLQADSYFLDGGDDNYVRAEAKYRDYLNRFPTSERSDYAQFQMARSLEERIRRPDRDQKPTRDALGAYEELRQLYPTSEFADKAEEGIGRLQGTLAEHEFLVGRFNLRRHLYKAAIQRFQGIVDQYPEFGEMDKVLYHLGLAQLRDKQPEEARATFARLRAEHPQSTYLGDIPEIEEAS